MGQRTEDGRTVDRELCLTVFCLTVFCLTPSLLAADGAVAQPRKIGVIRVGDVMEKYDRTKAADSKLEKESRSKQMERDKMVTDIKNMRDELVLLNEESRPQRQKVIEEKMKGLVEFDRQTKETLQKQRDEELQEILGEIEKTVSVYAKEHQFDLILTDRAVLFESKALDITDDIIALLNQGHGTTKSAS